jgi:tripartite-type tricarboxylate transporter receptor subunit TctC
MLEFAAEEDLMRAMKTFTLAMLCCAAALSAGSATAQNFPARQVTIIVPYPPGGLIALVARQIQARFGTELGQSVIVENRSGAGGNVGAEAVARASGDGYTLLLANPSLAISPLIYPKLNYSRSRISRTSANTEPCRTCSSCTRRSRRTT